ncbi:virulence RhuM family protein [Patescibacteria group bacterium]|nr:virulence RhuM family protein [Patescibacteria group bacterium]
MESKKITIKDELTEFLFYTSPNGKKKVEAFLHDENIWLTQKRIAELFGVDVRTISEHLQNIFKNGELEENSVIRNFRTTASDNKKYEVKFYNLDAILSVGYRVNSNQATQFRIWASKILIG